MNRIPVDCAALGDMRFLAGEARMDQDGKPVLRDGVPVQRVSVLVRPADGRQEVIEINVTRVEPVRMGDLARVRIMNLTARPWVIDGRDGISWNADDVTPLGGPQTDK